MSNEAGNGDKRPEDDDLGRAGFVAGKIVIKDSVFAIGGVRVYKMWMEDAPDIVIECMDPADFVPALVRLLGVLTGGAMSSEHLHTEAIGGNEASRKIADEVNARFRRMGVGKDD